ncbi:MAG: MFS transporter [Alphaproteobacteria bacterium]|nr:MFS transporter [Alphaproteobacteria bacterium]
MPTIFIPLAATLGAQAMGALACIVLPVLAPEAAPDYGILASNIGHYSGLIFLGATIASLLSGGWVARWGPIRVTQMALLSCGAGLAILPTGEAWLLPASALLVGFGYGPLTPASSDILSRRAPPAMMMLIFSLKQSGVPVGGALAGLMLPPLAVAYGWRVAALAAAGLCLALALAIQPLRRDLDQLRGRRRPFFLAAALIGPLRLVWAHPALRRLALTSLAFSAMQTATTSFYVTFLAERADYSLVQAGLALSVAQLAAVIGRVLWGHVADRGVAASPLLAGLGFGMAASIALAMAFNAGWPSYAVLAVSAAIGATVIAWNGVFLAETARQAPAGMVGEATGGVLSITFSATTVGPPAMSLVIALSGSYVAGYGVFALGCVAASVALVAGHRRDLARK